MKTIRYPSQNDWPKLIKRPVINFKDLERVVNPIFEDIRKEGDKALRKFTFKFDKVRLESVSVSEKEINHAMKSLSKELVAAIKLASGNIEKFHLAQKDKSKVVETTKGIFCWRESRAIEKVGIYIPGGSAPLFSTVLMLGIPAQIAGCKEIILCTPPDKKGKIDPAILFAARLVGITSIFKVGGIQAIGAMAFGTKSIPKVDKILGPGNQFVAAAKQLAQKYHVAIDMPAGPSELLIIADGSSSPEFIAADLLSQAEHGPDSQVILLSNSESLINKSISALKKQLKRVPRKDIAVKALKTSKAIVLNSIQECIEFSNCYAPEHLILAMKGAKRYIPEIINAGSVFIGKYSCESAGDYASGTNHTLPTNGYARNYSGVSLDTFVKKITFQHVTRKGLETLGPVIEVMAEAEQLMAHKNAVSIRLETIHNIKT